MSKFNSVNNLLSMAILFIFQLYKYLVFHSKDYSYFKLHIQLVFFYIIIAPLEFSSISDAYLCI